MKRYDPKTIELKWQKTWADQDIYKAEDFASNPKDYILDFFPYPSGAAMHVGHVRNYTISDVLARYARMRGRNVLHPMGWDAFGLPAENYAVKTGISPQQAVAENTAKFKQQLTQMGIGIDWTREIDSTDPQYYRWTQWLFKLLFERGLAYQKESLQWWCDTDKTVLANEQVEAGRCWRCGNEVTKKSLKQWFFKITDYADRLVDDLEDLDWSDAIKAMQRNWIGRSKGAEITFGIDGADQALTVFTTRADTLYGVTFMVLAPEHPLAMQITTAERREAVDEYVAEATRKSDIERQETEREKTGVFTGAYAINPANGDKVPVWVADYVLMGYGTGAIMAVPAHDERDFAFAEKFNLPVIEVIEKPADGEACYHGEGLMINSGEYSGKLSAGVRERIVADLAQKGTGKERINYKIRDWLISRQRYWGAPIPIVHCAGCVPQDTQAKLTVNFYDDDIWQALQNGTKTVESRALNPDEQDRYFGNVTSGDVLRFVHKTSGQSAFYRVGEVRTYDNLRALYDDTEFAQKVSSGPLGDWRSFEASYAALAEGYLEKINRSGIVAWAVVPLTVPVAVADDQLPVTLPVISDYKPSDDGRSPLARVSGWVNTTCPNCHGPARRETDTMDGFACSSWYFLRFADPHNTEQAFDPELATYWLPVDTYVGGAEHAVMHLLYARFWTKVMHDAGLVGFDEPFTRLRNHGMILAHDGRKMSKSYGNVVNPDDLISEGYGADSIRVMELFIGPWNQKANWSTEGLGGCYRFLNRIWTLVQEYRSGEPDLVDNKAEAELLRAAHRAIKKVTEDLEAMGFNTAIAALMEYVNALYKLKAVAAPGRQSDAWSFAIVSLVQLIAPFAPHMADELWHQLENDSTVHRSSWPAWDDSYLIRSTMRVVLQVNGKVRATLDLPADSGREAVEAAALAHERTAEFLGDKKPAKVIYVPGRLVNVVG